MLHIIPCLTMALPLLLTTAQAGRAKLIPSQKPVKAETVMTYGMKITATTKSGTMTITVGDGYSRAYTWEGATRTDELRAIEKRSNGSLGIYSPGAGNRWIEHNGISRGVLEEGRQHFKSYLEAYNWMREQEYQPTVYNETGLFVGWSKTPERGQLNVDVWQLYINGKKPTHLPGSNNSAIKVTYERRPSATTTLAEAVQQGNLGAVKTLLRKGANPNAKNNIGIPILLIAVQDNNTPIAQALLAKGADANALNADDVPALQVAIEKSALSMVKALLAAKANVNATRTRGISQGLTAFIMVSMGDPGTMLPIAKVLLDAGADPKAAGPLGRTALHWAAEKGNKPLVELLLSRGLAVDSRDEMGETPLMGAAMERRKEMVQFLIAHHANVNAKDDASSALYGRAGFVGDTETQKEIEKSGKLKTLHEDGRSVLDWAKIGGDKPIIEMLKKAGSKE
jgi:ankyrin repeat protein